MLNRLFLLTILILIFLLISGYCYIQVLHSKVDNLETFKGLYQAEKKQNVIYKDESNKWHNTSQVLEMEVKNLRQALREGDSTIIKLLAENSQIRKSLRNLNSYSQITTKNTTEFTAPLRDTIIKKDTIHHYARTFYWYNKFYEVSGIITKDSISPIITTYDSLSIVGWWERMKKIWFIKYGKKENFIDVKSNNPDTKIVYNRNIFIKRKR